MQGNKPGHENLSDVLNSAGKNLEYRQTGRDPKLNGYAYAEVPDWKLLWWEETARIMEARLEAYEAALREIADSPGAEKHAVIARKALETK